MCGIVGFAGVGEGFDPERLARMNESIVHRGPDDRGSYFQPGIGLAMRRLSILDLETSQQPIANEDDTVWTVFNGEIYNYRELRRMLEARGHTLRTQGDTEVLVHLYEEFGPDLVNHLRGMFAFAIWDVRNRTLVLARDRFGIKPLFYTEKNGGLLFASELKAIVRTGGSNCELDEQAIDAFLTFGYVPAPRTIYDDVQKLMPGHLLVFRDGRSSIREYWDLPGPERRDQLSEEEWIDRVSVSLRDAVESHLVSDVPLAAFLSGGVDSSLVTALMARALKEPVTTFTIGFARAEGGILDERPFAQSMADLYSLDYNEFTVEPDIRSILDEIVEAFDEPFADDSVFPTYWICKLTSERVKVALSGLGGDELFGGYHRYRGLLMSRWYEAVPRSLRSGVIDPLAQQIPEPATGSDQVDHIKRFARAGALPADLRYLDYMSALPISERRALYSPEFGSRLDFGATSQVITEPFNRYPSSDIVDRAMYTDMKTYLPDDILALSDRLSMWHSLELRVPLIDHELAEVAAILPRKYKVRLRATKALLKSAARGLVPDAVIDHRKQGFESPMARWLKGDLRDFSHEALQDSALLDTGLFRREVIEQLHQDHVTGRRKNNKILFYLFMLSRWLRTRSLQGQS